MYYTHTHTHTHTHTAAGKQVEKAKVLFEYVAEESDELSIKVGDIVEVLKKDTQEGWWEVRREGERVQLVLMHYFTTGPAQ